MNLSPRQLQVLFLTWEGLSVKQTAEVLQLAVPTIKHLRECICDKFGVKGAVLMVREGLKRGLIEADK